MRKQWRNNWGERMSRYIDASIPTADVAELVGEYNGLTAVEQLNLYRNKYYTDGNATEKGIIANAINDILPSLLKGDKA